MSGQNLKMTSQYCQELVDKAEEFTDMVMLNSLSAFPKIVAEAIIIVGESVSFGLADEDSDIDYGIVLPSHQDFVDFGTQINDAIGGRFHKHGRLLIDVHLCSLLSFGVREGKLQDISWWEDLDPTDVFAIQHAVILKDPNEIFRSLKEKTSEIPPSIVRRRIIGRWAFLNMWVDFVRQCIKRNDEIGSFTFTGRAVQEIMMIGFLLNGSPYPDPKYRYRLFLNLPKLSNDLAAALQEVSRCSDMKARYEILTNVVGIYSNYMRENDIIEAKYIKDWLQCFDVRAEALF